MLILETLIWHEFDSWADAFVVLTSVAAKQDMLVHSSVVIVIAFFILISSLNIYS